MDEPEVANFGDFPVLDSALSLARRLTLSTYLTLAASVCLVLADLACSSSPYIHEIWLLFTLLFCLVILNLALNIFGSSNFRWRRESSALSLAILP
jgi:hypothetical protein